tara:strand:+ start:898 stop:1308 length:411 start_codon:yes stop_codon:yes gene_type:complete
MEFNIRKLNSSDYDDILVDWWKDWGWEPPQKDFLPEDGEGGLIVLDKDIPVCAGFIYITNSKVSWINWIVSNKKYSIRNKRTKAFNLMIKTLIDAASKNNKKFVFANNNNMYLINRYLNLGFVKGCTNSTELIYNL